jgi:CBS domain
MAVSPAHIAHCGPSRGGGGGSNGNDPGIATPCENAFTALQLMGGENINQLPVVSNGHLEGVVTRSYFVHLLRLRRELSM